LKIDHVLPVDLPFFLIFIYGRWFFFGHISDMKREILGVMGYGKMIKSEFQLNCTIADVRAFQQTTIIVGKDSIRPIQ
jgi:hypothetical protein